MLYVGDDVLAKINSARGEAHMRVCDFNNALIYLNAAIEQNPNDPVAHWNMAMCLLSTGRYLEGFAEFERRWEFSNWPWALKRAYAKQTKPWGDGEIAGKRLLLVHDGGRGDNIMMLRYVPRLRAFGAEITILTLPELKRLSEQFGVEVITEAPNDLSRFDERLAMFSIMVALGETVQTIPPAPYLKATPRKNGRRIGLCWSGNAQKEFTLEKFLQQLELDGSEVQALQPGPVSCDVHPLPSGCDFLDVAELAMGLDHVVTVDTACANLMGALGHPSTHLVLGQIMDFRWYFGNSWYSSVRCYRGQERFAQIKNAIAAVPT